MVFPDGFGPRGLRDEKDCLCGAELWLGSFGSDLGAAGLRSDRRQMFASGARSPHDACCPGLPGLLDEGGTTFRRWTPSVTGGGDIALERMPSGGSECVVFLLGLPCEDGVSNR